MSWPMIAVLVALAAVLGFGASYWWMSRKAAAPAPAAAAQASEREGGVAEIKIPADYLAAANIAVEPVASGGIEGEVLAPATVTALPNSEAVIVARAAGTILRVNRRLGDTVRAGETLALVDSMEAASMAAERTAALAKAELTRRNFARESSLFQQGITPRQDMEAAQAALSVAEAEAQRASSIARAAKVAGDGRSIAVISPIAGKLTAQSATLGAFTQPQTELFRVSGSGAVQVEAYVSSADIARISAGDKATIMTVNGAPVPATVHAVTPTVSGNTRAATVILTPTAPVQHLIIGEGVQARLHVKENKSGAGGLIVPEDAVQNIDGRDVLFVRTKEGFRPQPVLVGARSGGLAQIVSGIKAGEQVATRNAFLVKADMIKSAKGE